MALEEQPAAEVAVTMPLGFDQPCGMGEPAAVSALPPAPMSAPAGFDPVELLVTLLTNIGRMDTDGFFEAPVREEDAPGYYDAIKRPMCFQKMREKLRAREYRTWRGFVEDFELICSNAMKYNQKRSRVHKSAVTMLRAGKKQLQNTELEGRKAIVFLHPEGPAAAAAEEAAEAGEAMRAATAAATAAARANVRLGGGAPSPGAAAAARPPPALAPGGALADASAMPPPPPGASTPRTPASALRPTLSGLAAASRAGSLPGTPTAAPAADAEDFQFDMHSDRDEGYSSFSGTESEDGEGGAQQQQQQPGAPSFWLPHMASVVDTQEDWGGQRGAADPAGRGRARARRSSAWKAARRGVEWRARWLELRIRALRHQERHYDAQLAQLRGASRPPSAHAAAPAAELDAQPDAAVAAAAKPEEADAATQHTAAATTSGAPPEPPSAPPGPEPGHPPAGVAGAAEAVQPAGDSDAWAGSAGDGMSRPDPAAPAQEQQQQDQRQLEAAPDQGSAEQPPGRLHWRRAERLQARELQAQHLLEHPFFAAIAGVRRPKQVPQSRTEAETEEETLPAAAYAMLELCQRHLAAVKGQLVQAPGQRQRPQKKVAQGPKGRARGGGASLAATRSLPARQRSSLLGAPAKYGYGGYAGGGLERSASFAKRRRTEYDAGDAAPSALAGAASVKYVERVQVAEISTPQVRPLPQAELDLRAAALAAYAAAAQQAAAEGAPAPDLRRVLAPAQYAALLGGGGGDEGGGGGGGGSSSEDTSDEAYAQRHRPGEEEERQRFLGAGGGAQKRNPADGKSKKPKPAAEGKPPRGDSSGAADARLRPAQKSPLGLPPLPSLLHLHPPPQQHQQQAGSKAAAAAAPQAGAPAAPGLHVRLVHPLSAAPQCLYAEASTPRAAAAAPPDASASVGTVQPPDAAQPLPFLSPITVGRAPDAAPAPPPLACGRAAQQLAFPPPDPPPADGAPPANGGSPVAAGPGGARPRGRPAGSKSRRRPGCKAAADGRANGRANGGSGGRAPKRARGRLACNGRANGRSETPEEAPGSPGSSSGGQQQLEEDEEGGGSDVDADNG